MTNAPITITGRLVSDPQYFSDSGLLRLRVASSRSYYKDNKWNEVDQLFINVEVWGNLATNLSQSLLKGNAVIVQGVLYTNTWSVNGDESNKRSENRIRAVSVGLDLNYYVVGYRDARPVQVHTPEGVEVPELAPEHYVPVPTSEVLDDASPEPVGELVGAGVAIGSADAAEEEPSF